MEEATRNDCTSRGNSNGWKRHQPLLNRSKLKGSGDLSPLATVVLSGAPLEVVKDVYNMRNDDNHDHNIKITEELIYDAYLYGVSNEDGVLDFLCDNLKNDYNNYEIDYPDLEENLNIDLYRTQDDGDTNIVDEEWITASGISLANLLPAFRRLLSRPNFTDVKVDITESDDGFTCPFDAKCFFGILKAILKNNNIRSLFIYMPKSFPKNGADLEGPEQFIESISAHVKQEGCKIKELGFSIYVEYIEGEYLDLFVNKVVMNLPELEELTVYIESSTMETTTAVFNLLTMKKLKAFEVNLYNGLPDGFWPTLLAPLTRASTLTNLTIRHSTDSNDCMPLDACRAELMRILLQSNTTLEAVTLNDENYPCLCAPLKFYLVLNQFGRGQCRDPNVTMSQLLHNLVSVQNWNKGLGIRKCPRCPCPNCPCKNSMFNRPRPTHPHHPHPPISEKARVTSYLYELLRECPNKWTTNSDSTGAFANDDNHTRQMSGCTVVRERRAKRKEPPPES